MDEAAPVCAPFVAAWSAIVTVGRLAAAETLLVTGVLDAVGQAATVCDSGSSRF